MIRSAVTSFSSRHRRWKNLRAELTMDPERLAHPIQPPSARDFIICGLSRGGTSLLAAALYQPPHVVTVMEPWDGMRFPPAELFASLRSEMELTGHLRRGRLDIPSLKNDGSVRWGRDGQFPHPVLVQPDFLLGVKWPAFWQYLVHLQETKFLICVRHPVEVVDSFRRTGGRLAQGFEYDIAFNRRMNAELLRATSDIRLRRVLLYEYVASRLLPHLERPNVFVVRYERWFEERERLISEIEDFLGAPLGRGYPVIRSPASRNLPVDELALIERHCPAARALGYTVRAPIAEGGPSR
jgi:Sulfotransferase domain